MSDQEMLEKFLVENGESPERAKQIATNHPDAVRAQMGGHGVVVPFDEPEVKAEEMKEEIHTDTQKKNLMSP